MEKNLIVATAGHVDHGKTTLIKALTGDDTDRLAEEKERGISIDLGFSHLSLNSDFNLGIIDVPGHEKFIKNMLAGAGGVDIALLVIAADEGMMDQTEEHLAILELLDVQTGVVAITKKDKVDPEWLQLVIADTKEQLADSFLAEAEVIPVSAINGTGLNVLKVELERLAKKTDQKEREAITYLPVDRAFSLQGIGTVVTGTLLAGTINVEQELQLYPTNNKFRVRGIEVHGQEVKQALPGQRVGINLADVNISEIERGQVLAPEGVFKPSDVVDARLKLLESAPFVLEHGAPIRFHIGAREVLGRVYLLDCKELAPGDSALAQFKLDEKIVASYGEDYVVRRSSPMVTIGGGKIIEPASYKKKRLVSETIEELEVKEKSDNRDRLEYILELEQRQALEIEDLVVRSSLLKSKVRQLLFALKESGQVISLCQEKYWLHSKNYRVIVKEMKKILKKYHEDYPLRRAMLKEELRNKLSVKLDKLAYQDLLTTLEGEGIEPLEAEVKLAEFEIEFNSKAEAIKDEIVNLYRESEFTPPARKDIIEQYDSEVDKTLAREILDYLAREEVIIKLEQDLYFAKQAIKKAKEKLLDALKEQDSIETGEYRDLLASSRRFTIPLLEHFDAQGLTKRKDNKRVLKINSGGIQK